MSSSADERAPDEVAVEADEAHEEPSFRRNLAIFFTFVFIIVPIIVLAVSFFFGLILAEVEGWSISDGFYYITSMLCGLPNPLTDVEPESTGGKIVDIIIAIWALALAGTVIGVVGGMSVIGNLIESAEKFGQKKNKGDDAADEGEKKFEDLKSGSETAALANRVAALESAVQKQTALLEKLLAK
jgi:hypothetical protein